MDHPRTHTSTLRARSAGLLAAALVACCACVIATSTTSHAAAKAAKPRWHDGPCRVSEPKAVTVVIDFQKLDGNDGRAADTIIRCVPASSERRTGIEVLQAAGVRVVGVARFDGGSSDITFVCRINARPARTEPLIDGYQERCQDTPPTSAYWSSWHASAPGKPWKYAPLGAAARFVTPGGVEGWSFALGEQDRPRPTPPARVMKLAADPEPPPVEGSDPVAPPKPAPAPKPSPKPSPAPRPAPIRPAVPATPPARSPALPSPSPSPFPDSGADDLEDDFDDEAAPIDGDSFGDGFDDTFENDEQVPTGDGTSHQQLAADAAGWLATEVRSDGTLPGPDGSTTDWGLTIDALLALRATNADDDVARRISSALTANAASIITPTEPGAGADGGMAGKLLLAGAVTGRDDGTVGGTDVRETTIERLTVDTQGETGTFALSIAVLGLARSGGADAQVVDTLLARQCEDGFFVAAIHQGCAKRAADTDATAVAVQALIAAEADEQATRSALEWLLDRQRSDGSYVGGATTNAPNANSTGLAAQALGAGAGHTPDLELAGELARASSNAGTWVEGLVADTGAIAYDEDALMGADDIDANDAIRDQWRRSTSQALLGLASVSLHELGDTALTSATDTGGASSGTDDGVSRGQLLGVLAGLLAGVAAGALVMWTVRRRRIERI